MRNTMTVLVMMTMLAGCLGSEQQSSDLLQSQGGNTPPGGGNPPGDNNPPSISGNPPPAVTIEESYDFAPAASDSDGDSLSFNIDNKPSWASFDTSSGRIFGSLTLGDIGIYDGIVISASDGTATSSLPPFTIDVVQTALGSVSLNWNAPTTNEDGSALTDLAGFKIYYGTRPGEYNREMQISNASVSTVIINQLTPNTYYFAASAFNTSGVESVVSGEIARVVN